MTHAANARTIILLLLLAAIAATVTACSQSPQEKYEHARNQLQQAQKNRNQAQKKVDETQKELAKRQEKLNAAQNKLQAAREREQHAAQTVAKTVSDAMLYRELQRKLLDKDTFGKSAISVSVNQRVATLTGNVPDQKTEQRAVKTARDEAGVQQVIDHLRIVPPDANPGTSGS